MAVETANDLFLRELGRLQSVEQMFVQMMPQERSECSADTQAQNTCSDIERKTSQQVQSLDRCFSALGAKPVSISSAVIQGIRQDHEAFIKEHPSPEATVSFDLREMAQIKQYGVASYRDLIDQAKQLGRSEVERFPSGLSER